MNILQRSEFWSPIVIIILTRSLVMYSRLNDVGEIYSLAVWQALRYSKNEGAL
jgi:hypothetical protein